MRASAALGIADSRLDQYPASGQSAMVEPSTLASEAQARTPPTFTCFFAFRHASGTPHLSTRQASFERKLLATSVVCMSHTRPQCRLDRMVRDGWATTQSDGQQDGSTQLQGNSDAAAGEQSRRTYAMLTIRARCFLPQDKRATSLSRFLLLCSASLVGFCL